MSYLSGKFYTFGSIQLSLLCYTRHKSMPYFILSLRMCLASLFISKVCFPSLDYKRWQRGRQKRVDESRMRIFFLECNCNSLGLLAPGEKRFLNVKSSYPRLILTIIPTRKSLHGQLQMALFIVT